AASGQKLRRPAFMLEFRGRQFVSVAARPSLAAPLSPRPLRGQQPTFATSLDVGRGVDTELADSSRLALRSLQYLLDPAALVVAPPVECVAGAPSIRAGDSGAPYVQHAISGPAEPQR